MEMIGAEHSPGVETTTGSLAQALSQACGIALARKMRGETGCTWVFMSPRQDDVVEQVTS